MHENRLVDGLVIKHTGKDKGLSQIEIGRLREPVDPALSRATAVISVAQRSKARRLSCAMSSGSSRAPK